MKPFNLFAAAFLWIWGVFLLGGLVFVFSLPLAGGVALALWGWDATPGGIAALAVAIGVAAVVAWVVWARAWDEVFDDDDDDDPPADEPPRGPVVDVRLEELDPHHLN